MATKTTRTSSKTTTGMETKPTVATPMPAATSPTPQKSAGGAIEAPKQDHRKVGLLQQICAELIIHTKLEEELFYPACRAAVSGEDILDEAQVEHDSAK